MPSVSVEASLEALLLRIVPQLALGWQGAAPNEVASLEAIAGRPLPAFYRWFLSRMGQSMGPMRYPTVDFSAQGILAAYATRAIDAHSRYLLIGYERDEVSPLHYFYDLDRPARGDALVVRMLTPRDESHEQFETFREMLAWGELWSQRVESAPQHCRGVLREGKGELYRQLDTALQHLGFQAPIETGAFCGLYERGEVALTCSSTPSDPPGAGAFGLGGHDATSLAQILSELTRASSIEVTLGAWRPPLPSGS